jgi:hypothetical protein
VPIALTALALAAGALPAGCSGDGGGNGGDGGDEEVAAPAPTPPGWQVTVYHTAVERFHDGPPRRVIGCVVPDCVAGRDHIGYHPGDFVDAVEFTGTGRLETGRYAGHYLNWSEEVGFWIDDFPRDDQGGVLVPFASAAAHPNVLAPGTVFQLADCGTLADGSPVPTAVCEQLGSRRWTVADTLTPGIAGERDINLYVGEESLDTFANGPAATSFAGVELALADGAVPANPFDPAGPAAAPGGTTGPTDLPGAPGFPVTTRPGATNE